MDKELKKLNRYQFHVLLTELISSDLKRSNFPPAVISYMRDLLSIKDIDQPTSEYLKGIIEPKDTIKQIVKKF